MPGCSAKNAMTAGDRLRIRKATTLAKGVPSVLPGGLASEDMLEINAVGIPEVRYNAQEFKPCCDAPLEYTDMPQPGDPDYTFLLYISDPESGDVPRSVAPVGESIDTSRYLDAEGKRKSWKAIREELKADRPVRQKSNNVKHDAVDEKAHQERGKQKSRAYNHKQVSVRGKLPAATRSVRAGFPNAGVYIYAEGPVTFTEYVNGVAAYSETYTDVYDDTYEPTQACKLSIQGYFITAFGSDGSDIKHVKFNWSQLANLELLGTVGVDIRGPLTIKNMPSLQGINIAESHIPKLNIVAVPSLESLSIDEISGLSALDLTQLGTYNSLLDIYVRFITSLKKLDIGNFPYVNELYVNNNPSLSALTLTNMGDIGDLFIHNNPAIATLKMLNNGYISDADINSNTIQNFNINGQSDINDYLRIEENTIGTLTIKNIGYLEDLYINDNNIDSLSISGIRDVDDQIRVNDNTGLTSFTVKDSNYMRLEVYGNDDLTSVIIDNIYRLNRLELSGSVLASWSLTNILYMNHFELYNLGVITTLSITDPSIAQSLSSINIHENPVLTSLTVSNTPALEYLDIYDNQTLETIISTQSSTNLNGYYNSNPVLETLTLTGGTYSYLRIHNNTNVGKTTGLQTLDMSNIQVRDLDVQANRLTDVVTGTQTITGQYIINLETALVSLDLTDVTLMTTGSGGQLNVAGNSSMTSITMPTTLINGLVFSMEGCDLNQATATDIEEYFYYRNNGGSTSTFPTQGNLSGCTWVVLSQDSGNLEGYNNGNPATFFNTSVPNVLPGWNGLINDRGWTIS